MAARYIGDPSQAIAGMHGRRAALVWEANLVRGLICDMLRTEDMSDAHLLIL